jgi:RND superfamily putative drug exporter
VRDTTRGDTALILIRPSESWRTDAAADLVRALRTVESAGVEALVGGPTAAIVDSRAAMGDGLVLAVSLVVGINLFLLFMAFGSIVVPIKAVVMNVASVAASFGALVWVFQDGHFASALGFEVPGGIDLTVPIILFSVVFGLSMDYEVFLLARIREEYLRTGDDHEAIALGLERTGSLITRAALLLVVVVVGFAAGEFLFVQELGVGMVLAILLDATLVRALLVPSTMAMLGHWNWWAPAPLARLWVRMGGRVVGH